MKPRPVIVGGTRYPSLRAACRGCGVRKGSVAYVRATYGLSVPAAIAYLKLPKRERKWAL